MRILDSEVREIVFRQSMKSRTDSISSLRAEAYIQLQISSVIRKLYSYTEKEEGKKVITETQSPASF